MARKKPERLTAEDVLVRFRIAEEYWGPLHKEQEIDHAIFELALPVKAPVGYNVVYPGTGRTIVMTAADHVTGNFARVQVPEAGLSKAAQDRSERLEKGLQAALYRASAALLENPSRTLCINGLWSGMMVAQGPIFDADVWGLAPIESDADTYESSYSEYSEASEAYEATKKTEWPFFWRPIDPRYVYPDPGTCGKKWVIVSYQRIAGDIKYQWPQWSMRLGSPTPVTEQTLLTWYECWTETERIYMVGSEILDRKSHRYGKPQFQIKAAGYGTDSGKPEERFRSILWSARSMIEAQIGAWSHRDALIRRTAWTQMLAPKGAGFDSLEPGTIKELDERVLADPNLIRAVTELNPMAIQAVDGEIISIDHQIQKDTFPDVVQGFAASRTGYGNNSLVAQAKVKYDVIGTNLASLLQEFLVDLAHCVEHVVEEPVPVWGHTKWGAVDAVLRPEDVGGLRNVIVTINPKLPAERANEIEMGGALVDRGVIDTDTYIQDFVGYENPGEMRIKVLRDRALNSPEIARVLSFAAALKGGYLDYVMNQAQSLGMDPAALLSVLGFGNPSVQTPAANQGAGAPQNVAAQRQAAQGGPTMFSGTQKDLQAPGPQQAVRDQAAPGVPIRTSNG